MKKYKLINKTTNQETLCERVVIDGFDYYVSDKEVKLNDPITDNYRVWFWRDDCSLLGRKKVIATNNPNIDIPKIIDIDYLAIESFGGNLDKKDTDVVYSLTKGYLGGFKEYYRKSQETHPFSEQDMIEFVDWLFLWQQNSIGEWKHQNKNEIVKSTKELLQVWKEQKIQTLYYE